MKIAQETLDIYAPLAHRLGMAKVKAELEDLALRVLHHEDYQELMRRVAKRRLEREAEINNLITLLHDKLAEVGIGSKIAGRPKHFYSIWKKMHEGGREFDEIYDLTAVRVLTSSVRDCYGALGVVHSLWKPVPGRFKDFIAMPKVNMYQSLHTTVIGPKGDPVEIQIRTYDMHRIAEEGREATEGIRCHQPHFGLRPLPESGRETEHPISILEGQRRELVRPAVQPKCPIAIRERPHRPARPAVRQSGKGLGLGLVIVARFDEFRKRRSANGRQCNQLTA